MKTIAKILLFGTVAAVLTGCKPSSISNQETMFIPEGAVIQEETTIGGTVPETSKYVGRVQSAKGVYERLYPTLAQKNGEK